MKIYSLFSRLSNIFYVSVILLLFLLLNFYRAHATDTYPLTIKAFNPGFAVDGKSNVGEFIELAKISDRPSISLAGFSLRYTNSSGKSSNIFEFPEDSQMAGETLLLRLANSPDSAQSDLNYTKTLALDAGPLELVYRGVVIDKVCWNGSEGCLSKFSSNHPTSAVKDLVTKVFSLDSTYRPNFDSSRLNYIVPKPTEEAVNSVCKGIIINELLSYYEVDKSEQFIEFFNPHDEAIKLDGCTLRYRNKVYPLSGNIQPADFLVYYPKEFSLTKNPATSSKLELVDANSEIIDSISYPHGQRRSASFALFSYTKNGESKWYSTFQPTPGAHNTFQEFKTCPAGKVLNESTGNCVKALVMQPSPTECPAGKFRNPLTGRCIKYNTKTSSTTICKEGYELNPETNRCRKIKDNTGANFPVAPETKEEGTTFIAFGALAIIMLIALGYLIFQFHFEILKFFQKIKTLFKKKK